MRLHAAIKATITLGLAAILAAGCASGATTTTGGESEGPTTTQSTVQPTAVYFAPTEGGSLSGDDLAAHPQVVVVHDQEGLTSAAPIPVALWIDKQAIPLVDLDWVGTRATEGWPVAVIGTPNEIYAFADLVPFIISLPYGAEPTPEQKAEPGFAVWMFTSSSGNGYSATQHGYPGTPSVDKVLNATDPLLTSSPILNYHGGN